MKKTPVFSISQQGTFSSFQVGCVGKRPGEESAAWTPGCGNILQHLPTVLGWDTGENVMKDTDEIFIQKGVS